MNSNSPYNFGQCGKCTKDPQIVLEEKKKKFIGINKTNKPILKVRVDGCLAIDGKKCDWLLIDIAENTAHFIELKGSDIKHAVEQLENAIHEISNPEKKYIIREFKHKHAYIIASRVKPAFNTLIQKAKVSFMKKYKTSLDVRNKDIEKEL